MWYREDLHEQQKKCTFWDYFVKLTVRIITVTLVNNYSIIGIVYNNRWVYIMLCHPQLGRSVASSDVNHPSGSCAVAGQHLFCLWTTHVPPAVGGLTAHVPPAVRGITAHVPPAVRGITAHVPPAVQDSSRAPQAISAIYNVRGEGVGAGGATRWRTPEFEAVAGTYGVQPVYRYTFMPHTGVERE